MKHLKFFNENKQLADKLYFKPEKLSNVDRRFIYGITRGDNTTKLISDIYFAYKDGWNFNTVKKNLPDIHKQLLNYNSNVFPIKDFDLLNLSKDQYIYDTLLNRQKLIDFLKNLPSQAIRNLKDEIRIPRNDSEMRRYSEDFSYFMAQISMLSNRNDETRKKIYNKIFKSGATLKNLLQFTDEKENLLGGVEYTKQYVYDLVNDSEYDEDMSIIYDKNEIMVVKIESAEAIKKIGCNSLWCFTYGENNYYTWNNYSYNGVVYVIIDFKLSFDDPEFMHVLIKPLKTKKYYDNEKNEHEIPLFNMSNDNWYNPYPILTDLVGKTNIKKLFTFDYE